MIQPAFPARVALVCLLALPPAGAAARPAGAPLAEAARRLDANRVNLRVANDGRFPFDASGNASGMLYPRGTANSLLFSSGLWLGGTVAGAPRVTVAEYTSEFAPGAMPGGVPDDPARPAHVVYKVARWTGDAADSARVVRGAAELAADPHLDPLAHHSWSEYMAGAVPHGAPWRTYRLPNTATPAPDDSVDVPGPDVRGDQMLWCVFNDADPARHTSPAGSTAPLGVEVRQSVFAYDRPGPLGQAVFVRWDVLNRGANTIPDLRMAVWSDPDVGSDFHDDLAGCDTTRSLAFAYNTLWGADPAFGSAKPAVGFDLLAEHDSPALLRPSGMDAFVEYVNGADPASAAQSWNLMRGLYPDGSPHQDAGAASPSPFFHAGDPIRRSGGHDRGPGNNKTLATSGPWASAPGDTHTFWVAIVVGQAETPAGSLRALWCASDDAQDAFDAGFAEPFAAPRACEAPAAACPRGADWWAARCAAGDVFTPAEWNAIALWADSASANLIPTPPPRSGPFCQSLGWQSTTRDSAVRELLALLANAAVSALGLAPPDGSPVGLPLETGVLAPPLEGSTVLGLLAGGNLRRGLRDAVYANDNTAHRRALAGTGTGLPFFQGGAGTAASGSGSGLDPYAMPDSFHTVLLRFDPGAGQKAYRFLRLETAAGDAPASGRAYRYGGHRTVPLTAWDLNLGLQLELAFSERAVTADDGTLRPAASQVASFDSTWAPAADDSGGFERLWVIARPYTPVPRPAFAADGVPLAAAWPALYQLDARRRADTDVLDGDAFLFEAGWPRTGSADALIAALAAAAPADSEAARTYRELTASLRDVNLGLGIGPVCVRPVRFAATLVEASADAGRVRLRWRLGEPTTSARLEWRAPAGVWLDAGAAALEPGGYATAEFGGFGPGRHAYRLVVAAAIGIARSDSVWLEAPAQPALAMTGVWPNPSGGAARVSFTLPSGGAAKLEVFDPNGRRAYARDLGTLAPGLHHVEIAPGRRFRPGVYFAVLRFGGERRTARFVAL